MISTPSGFRTRVISPNIFGYRRGGPGVGENDVGGLRGELKIMEIAVEDEFIFLAGV